jgi:hypothetical protein
MRTLRVSQWLQGLTCTLLVCSLATVGCVHQGTTTHGEHNLMPELRELGSQSRDSDTVAR